VGAHIDLYIITTIYERTVCNGRYTFFHASESRVEETNYIVDTCIIDSNHVTSVISPESDV
jgi:hypothetical protein